MIDIKFKQGTGLLDRYVEKYDNFPIKEITEIVEAHEKENVSKSRTIDGSPARKLKATTIEAKRRKGSPYPSRVFYDTGLLVNKGIVSKIFSKIKSRVYVIPERANIMVYLAEQGRQAFGIGQPLIDKIRSSVTNWMKKAA